MDKQQKLYKLYKQYNSIALGLQIAIMSFNFKKENEYSKKLEKLAKKIEKLEDN